MDEDEEAPDAFVAGIVHKIMKLLGPRSMSRQALKTFSMDLVVIALGIRVGYLIDVPCHDPIQRYGDLITALREEYNIFKDVVHLYEAASDQSFIVNDRLLRRNLCIPSSEVFGHDGTVNNGLFPVFVSLHSGSHCELIEDPPRDLRSVLLHILSRDVHLPSSVTLPPGLTAEALVPLAAVLLEYPVGYVPVANESPPYLCGVPLAVYEGVIRFSQSSSLLSLAEARQRLLKFSVPEKIAEQRADLQVSTVRAALVEKFEGRVQQAFYGATFEVDVSSGVVINNGVAM